MRNDNIWLKAKQIKINAPKELSEGFNIGFDAQITQDMKKKLVDFVLWVENNYNIPITLWVDFEYKHYLFDRNKKQVGYLFYWSEFSDYPNFNNKEDIPAIKLPVRDERYSFEEILESFVEALTCYFALITNQISDDFEPKQDDVDEILDEYFKYIK